MEAKKLNSSLKPAHTPTPWKLKDSSKVCVKLGREELPVLKIESLAGTTPEKNAANAAHIVKCVNLHDDLINRLSTIHSRGKGYQISWDEHDKIGELLARARGES